MTVNGRKMMTFVKLLLGHSRRLACQGKLVVGRVGASLFLCPPAGLFGGLLFRLVSLARLVEPPRSGPLWLAGDQMASR